MSDDKMFRGYRLVLIEEAIPGMVLSDNLLDRHGKILLPRDTVLNEKLLESLRRHDIDMIPIFAEALTEEQKAVFILEQQQRLEQLFRKRNYDRPNEYANEVLLYCLKRYRQEEAL